MSYAAAAVAATEKKGEAKHEAPPSLLPACMRAGIVGDEHDDTATKKIPLARSLSISTQNSSLPFIFRLENPPSPDISPPQPPAYAPLAERSSC